MFFRDCGSGRVRDGRVGDGRAAGVARASRDELLGRLARVFGRREPQLQAGKYVDGLLSDTPRKNGWSLAQRAGDRTPDKMQRLLSHAVWDEHDAMGIIRDFVAGQSLVWRFPVGIWRR